MFQNSFEKSPRQVDKELNDRQSQLFGKLITLFNYTFYHVTDETGRLEGVYAKEVERIESILQLANREIPQTLADMQRIVDDAHL